jgi:serine/threonine protein kinase
VVLADRYGIEQTLGHGGMADVYRCRDRVLGRDVAVKVLRKVTADPAARARFVAEARLLAGLSHPGQVTVLDAGIEHERPFLVMELVDGRTLAAACRPDGLDVPRTARWCWARWSPGCAFTIDRLSG